MSIISKQIGWSQESNLLWYILDKLDRLGKVLVDLKPKFKSYEGLLTSDRGNINAINIHNTLLPNPLPISRYDTGLYLIDLSSISEDSGFLLDNLLVSTGTVDNPAFSNTGTIKYWLEPPNLLIQTFNESNELADNILYKAFLSIKLYNI
jgi:hypothetical protein